MKIEDRCKLRAVGQIPYVVVINDFRCVDGRTEIRVFHRSCRKIF